VRRRSEPGGHERTRRGSSEGQTLENGAVLERIEQDGIVLIQGGQRLKLRSESARASLTFRSEIE